MTNPMTDPPDPDASSPSEHMRPEPTNDAPAPTGIDAAAAPAPHAHEAPKPQYAFLAVLSTIALVADLWTKRWAVMKLEKDGYPKPPMELVKGRLNFHLARNPGGAWGMFQNQPESVRKPFFVLVSVIAVVVIFGMYRKLDRSQRALKWGLPLVLGGALGNLVDRIRFSKVVDFIDVIYWKDKAGMPVHWPTFNVADIAICVGVGLMAVDFLFPGKAHRTPPSDRAAKVAAEAPKPAA